VPLVQNAPGGRVAQEAAAHELVLVSHRHVIGRRSRPRHAGGGDGTRARARERGSILAF
jgi:hypothetical protein